MIVTINTDASWHNTTKLGTFAFWIVCNEFRIKNSGVLKQKCKSPEVAEFRCILNAFHKMCMSKDYSRVKWIIVNTDCLNVIHLLTDNKKAIQRYKLASWGNNLVKSYKLMLKQYGIKDMKIEFRHVKSHTGIDDKRSIVNEWCDTQAKRELWKKINAEKEQDAA